MATWDDGRAFDGRPHLARPARFTALREASYVYAETLWPDLGPEQDSLRAVEELARRLLDSRGSAFQSVVRTDRGEPVTPGWLDATAADVDPAGTRVVVSGSLAHAALGLPHAFDLAGRHGTTAGFDDPALAATPPLNTNAKFLFRGDVNGEWLEAVPAGGFVSSFDLAPGGREVAVSECWGFQGASIATLDLERGEYRFLTSGGGRAPVRWSPDGAWLLCGRMLVEPATGRWFRLPVDGAPCTCWWPARSASSLMLLTSRPDGPPTLAAYDLEAAAVEQLGPVEVPYESHTYVRDLAVSPDGGSALCATGAPAPPGFRFGGGTRLSLLDVDARRIEPLEAPYFEVGDVLVEREHRNSRWLGRPEAGPVVVHDSLLDTFEEPSSAIQPENVDYVRRSLQQLAEYGLEASLAAQSSGSSAGAPVVEVLPVARALAQLDPGGDAYAAVAAKLDALERNPATPPPHVADAWRAFFAGWHAIRAASDY